VVPGPQSEIDQSLAFPTDLAFSSDGQTLYVAAFGSGKVGVLDPDDLEAGIITENQVVVGKGPSGVVLDETHNRLYVMNRIDHTVSVVSNVNNPATRAVTATVALRYDPSPPAAKTGRRFLYDATKSGHGDAACASCHIFGDFDSLAWDLGDPFGTVMNDPNPFRLDINGPPHTFHPMKGPMTTQSLRGMADPAGPMHWRGDRTGGNDPGGDALAEDQAFKKFNPAFVGLLGAASQLSTADMQVFTDFILTVRYPPNPIRALDNTLTATQASGQSTFTTGRVDALQPCSFCHQLPIGTDGRMSFEGEPQEFKIAHQRNLYQKIGMFGVPTGVSGIPATGFLGDQVRGFGFLHDGSIPTVFDFLQADVFQFASDTQRRNVEAFVQSFDTGLAPIVGQQVSAAPANVNDANVIARINLLIARDDAGECDLVVKGVFANQARGWLYNGSNQFKSDRGCAGAIPVCPGGSDGLVDKDTLRAQAAVAGQELTYTCVPPGSGTRIAVDRDEDGYFDRTELANGSDPANPLSIPGGTTTSSSSSTSTTSSTLATTSTSSSSTLATSSTSSTSSTSTSTSVTTSTAITTTTTTSTTSTTRCRSRKCRGH
jgi:hypothetical protein